MEMLSEHTLEGWLEGYLLTGRHGFFSTYEAFVHVIDSMFNQHAKWLEMCSELSWRADLSSLNLLITSTVWRQDHNGFTHQDPGFLDLVVNKSAAVTASICRRMPTACCRSPITACAAATTSTSSCPTSRSTCSTWTWMRRFAHCTKGIGIWDWASNDAGQEPDVVMAAAGDMPTKEALAALGPAARSTFPTSKMRFINVVDLFRLLPDTEHPHGLSDRDFDSLFTPIKPGHLQLPRLPVADPPPGVPAQQSRNLHVRGYKEKGNGQLQPGEPQTYLLPLDGVSHRSVTGLTTFRISCSIHLYRGALSKRRALEWLEFS